jgi:hypothetical protein
MNWNALAHRALFTATLYGQRNIGRVAIQSSGDLVVTVDEPRLEVFPQSKLVAVMVASTAALAYSASEPRAPASTPERIRELVELAARQHLSLIEPELLVAAAGAKTAADRAVRATLIYGSTARALLFIETRSAPKNGLVKLHEERVLDGWIEARIPIEGLAELAPNTPTTGRDLLRAVRGNRPASSSDGPQLAKLLARAWREGSVELYAADPAQPLV